MKDRVKAREDIRMQIRITNLLLTTFVSFSSLMFLRILEKGELDRIPSLLALSQKKFFTRLSETQSYRYFCLPENPKDITLHRRQQPVTLQSRFSPPLCSRNFAYPRAIRVEESDPRPSFRSSKTRSSGDVIQADDELKKARGRKRKVTSVGGEGGAFVAEWKRMERGGGKSCSLPLVRVEDFLPPLRFDR